MFLSDYSIIIQCHIVTRDGKEPSLLEFGSVWVLPNIRVRSVLKGSFQLRKNESSVQVRFFV